MHLPSSCPDRPLPQYQAFLIKICRCGSAADMATEPHGMTTAGISSRRTACDKCRFAKARCLRAQQPGQLRCERCIRTHSECFTSPIFRLRSWQPPEGNMRDPHGRPNKHRARRDSEKGQGCSTASEAAAAPRDVSGPLEEQLVNAGRVQDLGGCVVADRVAQGLGWTGNEHLAEHNRPSQPDLVYGQDDLHGHLDASFAHLGQHFDIDLSEALLATEPPAVSRTDSVASPYPPHNQSSELPPGPEEHGCSPRSQDRYGSIPQESHETPAEADPMEQLSKLHYELTASLSHLEQDPPGLTMMAIFEADRGSSCPSAMKELLNRTTEFIAVLKLLAGFNPSPSSASPAGSSHPSIIHGNRNKRRRSDSTHSTSDYGSVLSSPVDVTNSAEQSSPSIRTPSVRCELDTPALLFILTIYIRFLKLHSIVLAHVYQHLKKLSESEHPYLPPFPGFSINGSFSICEFTN